MNSPSASIWLTADSSVHFSNAMCDSPVAADVESAAPAAPAEASAPSKPGMQRLPIPARTPSRPATAASQPSSRAPSQPSSRQRSLPLTKQAVVTTTATTTSSRAPVTNPFTRRHATPPPAPTTTAAKPTHAASSQPPLPRAPVAAARTKSPAPSSAPLAAAPAATPSAAVGISGISGIGGASCFLDASIVVRDPAPEWSGENKEAAPATAVAPPPPLPTRVVAPTVAAEAPEAVANATVATEARLASLERRHEATLAQHATELQRAAAEAERRAVSDAQRRIAEAEARARDAADEAATLRHRVDKQATALSERDVRLDIASEEVTALTARVQALEAQQVAAAARTADAERNLAEARQQAAALEKQVASSQDVEAQVRTLRAEIAQLSAAHQSAVAAREEAQSRLAEAEMRLADLSDRAESQQAELTNERNAAAAAHAAQLHAVAAQHAQETAAAAERHMAELTAAREETMVARAEVARLIDVAGRLEAKLRDLDLDMRHAKERFEREHADLRDERDALNARVATLEGALADAVAKEHHAATAAATDRARHHELVEQLRHELREATAALAAQNNSADTEVDSLREQLQAIEDRATRDKAAWSRERLELMTKESEASAAMASMRRQLDALRAVEAEANELRRNLEKEKAKGEALEQRVAEQLGAFAAYQQQVAAAGAERARLESRCIELEEQLSRRASMPPARSPTPRHPASEPGAFVVTHTASNVKTTTAPVDPPHRPVAPSTPVAPHSRKTSRSAAAADEENNAVALTTATSAFASRSASSASQPALTESGRSGNQLPAKRGKRDETQRVFTLTGFSTGEVEELTAMIRQLPNASVVESDANKPVPASVTHCVKKGTLTVKLMSAAVKGCWLVPPEFVRESAARGSWVVESQVPGAIRTPVNPIMGKTIGFSHAFANGRRFPFVKIVCTDGGATLRMDPAVTAGCDMVLCSSAEEASFNGVGLNFEKFLNLLAPGLTLA